MSFRHAGFISADFIRGGTIAGETIVIAGGDGELRSDNFQAGVAGWRIGGDGAAEFNDVTVRGTFTTTGNLGESVVITEGEITIRDFDGKEVGRVSGSIPEFSMGIDFFREGIGPFGRIYMDYTNHDSGERFLQIEAAGAWIRIGDTNVFHQNTIELAASRVGVGTSGRALRDNGGAFDHEGFHGARYTGTGSAHTWFVALDGADHYFRLQRASGVMRFAWNGSTCNSQVRAGGYVTSSSAEAPKTNIAAHDRGLDVVRAVAPKEFDLDARGDPETSGRSLQTGRVIHRVGFVAEDVEAVAPEVCAYDDEGDAFGAERASPGQLEGYDLAGMLSVLWRATQQIDGRVAALEAA